MYIVQVASSDLKVINRQISYLFLQDLFVFSIVCRRTIALPNSKRNFKIADKTFEVSDNALIDIKYCLMFFVQVESH